MVVLAATDIELAGCRNEFNGIEFISTGMGATNTAINTMKIISDKKPDILIQIGIAGAIDKTLSIGEAVFVIDDFQADLGAWREVSRTFEPFKTPNISVTNFTPLRSVSSQSVNTACSPILPNDKTQIESMEGAAFFQVAAEYPQLKFVQIRAISNYINTPREKWDIEKALKSLPLALKIVIDSL